MKWVKILHSLPWSGADFAELEELQTPPDLPLIPLTPPVSTAAHLANLSKSFAAMGTAITEGTSIMPMDHTAAALDEGDGAEVATDFAEHLAAYGLDLVKVNVDHPGHGAMSQLHLTFDFSPGTPDAVVSALVAYLQETT